MNLQTVKPRARQVLQDAALATTDTPKERVWHVVFPDSPTKFTGHELDQTLKMAHRWRLHRITEREGE